MATFADMLTDLRLLVMGNLKDDTLKRLLNRAQSQILEVYDWSFLLTNAVINSSTPKTAGTITVSQGSPVVAGTGTAFGREDIGAFLWVGGLGITPVPIQGVQGTSMLTLSAPWCGPSMVQSSYTLNQLYYIVEGALEIMAIRGNVLYLDKLTREQLNHADPARLTQGAIPCLKWAPAPASPDGSVMVELWPPSGGPLPYLVEFKRAAVDMVEPNDKPLCPYEIIEAKAAAAACRMMFASTGQNSWMALAERYSGEYSEALEAGRHMDSKRSKHANGVTSPAGVADASFNAFYQYNHDSNP